MYATDKLLLNAASAPEAGMICGILEDAGIPYYTKTPGAGTVYAASVNMGVKIYVSAEDYERARELVDELNSAQAQFVDFPEEEKRD